MSDGSQTEVSDNVKETALGGKEFSGSLDAPDPLAPRTTRAPDGIPEKFWDPIEGKLRTDDLIKSYQSLEAKLGQPKDDDEDEPKDGPEDDDSKDGDEPKDGDESNDDEPKDGDEDEPKDGDEPKAVDFKVALEDAQKVYAETGELPDEARQPFRDMGFTDQHIDLYLSGVKATEAALRTTAHKAAGSEEAYNAAIKWAAEGGLTPKQIEAFNSQVGDVETVGPAVAGLMASFKAANPGEGKLLDVKGDVSKGDVYEDMDEFQQDLAKADQLRDKVARRKAIDKLRRSREAGSIKAPKKR